MSAPRPEGRAETWQEAARLAKEELRCSVPVDPQPVAQDATLENAEKLETYAVESVEWAHPSNDLEPGTTRLVVKGTIPQVGAGDRIAFLRATVEGA